MDRPILLAVVDVLYFSSLKEKNVSPCPSFRDKSLTIE